ncbi:UPF0182 family protein [Segniliparus rugosus]|uniref:Uncharacterized protein n=1 Tax=Segniliparus rugosus (strain ATCC BAA-974 / DSM 45345 / CCUG 50838 / CIP 108380 / JCM 13579 / CDC 945) TaxID=679197 RepID=E5XRR6_SEGRC|nr:UPF0182 family protein [Segniliparus rugosus]EFV12931.2 hypothetical protein HMPREF9336_02188 [Segniliparus rugosus ATCC BAA-974]
MSPRTVPRRVRAMSTIVGVLLAVVFLLLKLVGPYTDWLWFRELGQTSVFFTVLRVKVIVFCVATALVGGLVFVSLWLAYRSRPMFIPVTVESPIARYRAAVETSVRLFGFGLPLLVGALAGFLMQANWPIIELYLHGAPFGIQDPQFHYDISFYVFDLPFYVFVLDTLEVVAVVCFVANLVTHYLFDGIRPSRSASMLTRAARVQLATIAGIFFLLKAVGYWFDQYELLFSTRREALFYGPSYTDITAVLPAKLILTAIAVICAAAFFSAIVLRDLRVPALATALMLLSSVLVGMAWPATVQWLTATPNAKEVERQYIERNIKATQQAFNLTGQYVKTEDWAPPQDKSKFAQSVQEDKHTLNNLRILDPNLISPTFTQQQRRKTFYGFPSQLALDRYTVDGQLRDYVVAVRELATANLTGPQTSWQNQHMVYTHGNGFVAAPANQVTGADQQDGADQKANGASQGGFPIFTSSDTSDIGDPNTPEALRVTQPRVYFGELIGATDADYAIVGGPAQEYDADAPAPSFSYDGRGGVPVSSMLNRLAFMVKYRELNFLRSDQITEQSKLIFIRDPRTRVAKVAPWLTLDEKAYPAVVDGRIQWIVDGYTTLAQFPYSKPVSLRDATLDSLDSGGNAAVRREQLSGQIAYIRNSVKATVDAYDGTVTLYQQDEKDPVLKAWMGVFPGLVKAKSQITPELAAHFRYPEDLFKVQRALLTRYHVDKPDTFFEGSEQWSIPVDPTQASGQLANQASQPPYYVVATDPNHPGRASFQLTTVMTPQGQPYLSAYLSVASDPDDYGTITVRRLTSKPSGPSNAYGRLRTSPQVNNAITLLGSADIRYGNLLTVPVGDGGLLYLEPIYTQAKNQESAFPTLANVYVFFDDKIGFETKLGEALQGALKQAGIDIDLSAVITPQQQQDPPPAAQEPVQPQQPPAPSQTKQQAQARLQALSQDVDNAQKALDSATSALESAKGKLGEAQKSGDFVGIGQALAAQQRAMENYSAAVRQYQAAVIAFRQGVSDLALAPN